MHPCPPDKRRYRPAQVAKLRGCTTLYVCFFCTVRPNTCADDDAVICDGHDVITDHMHPTRFDIFQFILCKKQKEECEQIKMTAPSFFEKGIVVVILIYSPFVIPPGHTGSYILQYGSL